MTTVTFPTSPTDRSPDRAARLLSVLAAVVVAAVVITATLVTASGRRQTLLEDQRRSVDEVLSRARTSLELTINAHTSVAATLAASITNLGRTPTQDEFDRLATLLRRAQPDLRAVELAPDGVITFVSPVGGNEAAIGLDLNEHPTGAVSMQALRDGRDVVIEGPIELVQGSRGLLVRHRVDLDVDGDPSTPPALWGAAITVVDFAAITRSAGLEAPDVSWSLERQTLGAAQLAGDPQGGREPLTYQVRVPGAVWTLAGSPATGWAAGWERHLNYIIAGIVLALVLAILVWATVSEPRRLRRKVREATAELARSNAHTTSVMNAASDAILALDPSGHLLASNPATWRLLAVDPEELDGETLSRLVPLDEVDMAHRADDGVLSGRATIRVQRADGSSFPAEVAIAAAPGGAVRTVIIRDVTERERTTEDLRRHAQELERLNAELRELDQVKRDFMAVASHEIRTPITAIRGFAVTLSRHWETLPDDDRRRSLDVIHRQATRLWHLVNDVLTTSQIEGGQVSARAVPVHVASAVDRAIVDSQIPPGDVVSRVPKSLTASIDREHLTRILIAFLTNAAKYGRAPVEVSANLTVDGLVVSVHDQGDGVPTEFRGNLFEPFSQASTGERRTAVGTGLGLSVARGLARAGGGDIWYDEHPQGGAVFHLRLPVSGMDSVAAAALQERHLRSTELPSDEEVASTAASAGAAPASSAATGAEPSNQRAEAGGSEMAAPPTALDDRPDTTARESVR